MGPHNNKIKEKEKKIAINEYELFVWEGRKMKYGLFLWTEGVYYLICFKLVTFQCIIVYIFNFHINLTFVTYFFHCYYIVYFLFIILI